jgi:aryl-alcohol dehydrogenase-like predicted oxidoreductase
MKYRILGSSGLNVSSLGFGCGAVGGLLVRGEFSEMVRTVAYAVDSGITYFDTAALYGNGASERNLGNVLHELKPKVVVAMTLKISTRRSFRRWRQASAVCRWSVST